MDLIKDKFRDARDFLKKIEPLLAIMFLVVAIFGVVQLYQYNKIIPEVKANCGWDKSEKVKCFCEKSEYELKKEILENPSQEPKLNFLNKENES